jgi:hypothetical protein
MRFAMYAATSVWGVMDSQKVKAARLDRSLGKRLTFPL